MEIPSYIKKNTEELIGKAPDDILDIIDSEDIQHETALLIKKYGVEKEGIEQLFNIITYILIGAIESDDVVQALQDLVNVTPENAIKIATDLEQGILAKAQISLSKPSGTAVATLEFQGAKSKEDLRKDILDTTKRESALTKPQGDPTAKKPTPIVLKPGSRSQLLEQLQVLGTIPDDDEISIRLAHIQEQMAALKKQEEDNSLDSKIALKSFMFGEKGKTVADSTINKITFSVPPTRYNVDPYREVDEV